MRSLLSIFVLFALVACDQEVLKPDTDSGRLDGIVERRESGDFEAAAAELRAYLKDFPKDAIGWTILGHTLEELEKDDEAADAYEKALKLDPECFQAVTGQGILYRKHGDYDKAMACYRRALEIDPTYAQAFSSMTVIALKQNEDASAITYAKRGYELDPEDPVIAANLAVAFHCYGDPVNRDRMTKIARDLGYGKIDTLLKIYSGELTVRD